MIDPFTAFAAVKSVVSAGKELVNVTKQIGEFLMGWMIYALPMRERKTACSQGRMKTRWRRL